MKKKKLLFILQGGVGGAERVSVLIGKSFDRTKYEVVFCLIGRTDAKQPIEDFIPEGFRIIKRKKAGGLLLIKSLYNVLKTEKPNIAFSSIMYINTKLLFISKLFRNTKFIVRNNNYLYTLSVGQKAMVWATYWMADKIVAQTDEMASEIVRELRVSPDKVKVLMNPIDVETVDAMVKEPNPFDSSNTIRYIASGRFHKVKGFDILVKAFAQVQEKIPNSELYIIGKNDGNNALFYEEVLQQVKRLDIEKKVFFLGFLTNPYIYVKNADCFVLSSRNEGLPNVLIEALYLGTPVAATTCIPVISRIVKEGKTGYLAKSDDVESLAEAMLKVTTLGRVNSTYTSASLKDFSILFDDDKK